MGESPEPAGSGKGIAEGKGVHREVESERSRMWEQTNQEQISGLTNRNHIRARMRGRLPYKSKPNAGIMRGRCGRQMEGKKREIPGAVRNALKKGNRGHRKEATLNAQESDEAVVPAMERAKQCSRSKRRKESSMKNAKTPGTAAACKGTVRNSKSMQECRVLISRRLEKRESESCKACKTWTLVHPS